MSDPELDTIVEISIDSTVQTPSRPGFGLAMLMSGETPGAFGSALVREFTSDAEMITAGFAESSRSIRKARAYFGQNPKPAKLFVGRRQLKPTKKYDLTIVSPSIGAIYSIAVNGVTYSFTAVDVVAANVATGLAAAIPSPASGYTKATAGAVITLTAVVPGIAPALTDWNVTLPTGPTAGKILLSDTTVDPGINTDLAACRATALGGSAYFLLLDQAGKIEIDAAETWAESNGMFYAAISSDDEAYDPDDHDDFISNAAADNLMNTLPIFSYKDTGNPIDAAIVGRKGPIPPGTENWAHTLLSVATVQEIPPAIFNAIHAKRGNMYVKINGASVFWEGTMAGPQWADSTRGYAWLKSELQVGVFEEFLNNEKIPFSDLGVDQIKNRVLGILMNAAGPRKFLDPKREISVSAPLIADLTAAQRKARKLPDVEFIAYENGTINTVQIRGRITP